MGGEIGGLGTSGVELGDGDMLASVGLGGSTERGCGCKDEDRGRTVAVGGGVGIGT
jgi:hypothetical protein